MMRRRKLRELKVKWNPERRLYEPVLLERHVVKEIIDRLWLQAHIKMRQINQPIGGKVQQNEAGIPDLMGWIPKRLCCNPWKHGEAIVRMALPLYIEVKRPGGARRIAQIRFIEEAKADGCVAFFAESFNDVVKELKPFGIVLTG